MKNLLTENIDIWTSVQIQKKGNGRGNGSANQSHYGIKKLRELILELAVRGKLVPQDPNDEPASVLLEKIAKEKERLIKEGKIKKQEHLSKITEEEKPFEVPKGWVWARLTELYYSISPSGKKLKSSEISDAGKFPVVDQGKSYIAGYTDNLELLIRIPHPIILFGDHTTEIKYIDFNFVAGADGTKILCPYKMHERYFYTYLLTYKLEDRGYARHFKVLNDNLMALPPYAEQHRIVAKVDELMAICDQLEQKQTGSNAAHQTLVETLLATLTSAANRDEFIETWQRLASNFDILFTTEQSIDQLKRTILQLAVMGKLVSQDPNDEPASVLLKKIADEKARLVKKGKIKKG
ncbi:MAG: restriction endonuclease subunit S, partial [Smithellaceae bacterium]